MGYHIFLTGQDNFEICVNRGVYGGIHNVGSVKSEQMNSEIISSFCGIRPGDFVFFYVKNIGIYGLWKITREPFYDEKDIWHNPKQLYPYRVCFEPVIRRFDRAVALSDILDLRDKGKIWTFDLGIMMKKSHYIITTEEGKEVIRLLLRNNPIYKPPYKLQNPYSPFREQALPLSLECDNKGRIRYEGFLNSWFMKSFSQNKLKDLIGEYKDFLNSVPTSFNKVMDIFLTHVTTIDSVDILHKFTCMELKAGKVSESDLNQIIRYENWLIRKLADGDSEMVQSILVGFDFDEKVLVYRRKRKAIEEKTLRLFKYKIDFTINNIILEEIDD